MILRRPDHITQISPRFDQGSETKFRHGRLQGDYECGLLYELLHLEGARALAVYGDDFYAGMPVVTVHSYGEGQAYYVATAPEERFLRDLCDTLCGELGLAAPLDADAGIELAERHKAGKTFTFVLNHNAHSAKVRLPGSRSWVDLLSKKHVDGEVELEANGVLILERG